MYKQIFLLLLPNNLVQGQNQLIKDFYFFNIKLYKYLSF